jgi:hypothetical protein
MVISDLVKMGAMSGVQKTGKKTYVEEWSQPGRLVRSTHVKAPDEIKPTCRRALIIKL